MDDQILSVTGRDVPNLTLTTEDRGRLWGYLHPFVALPAALSQPDWIKTSFLLVWIVGTTAVWRFGQPKEARTTTQKIVFSLLWVVSVGFLLTPESDSTLRLAGLVIAPMWFVADVVLARSRRSPPPASAY